MNKTTQDSILEWLTPYWSHAWDSYNGANHPITVDEFRSALPEDLASRLIPGGRHEATITHRTVVTTNGGWTNAAVVQALISTEEWCVRLYAIYEPHDSPAWSFNCVVVDGEEALLDYLAVTKLMM